MPQTQLLQWRVDPQHHILICKGDSAHEMLRYDKEFGDLMLRVECAIPRERRITRDTTAEQMKENRVKAGRRMEHLRDSRRWR